MLRKILFCGCILLLNWTVLKGQEKRDLLEKSLKGLEWSGLKLEVDYPGYQDRNFWDSLAPDIRTLAIRKAERSMQVKPANIPLSAYLQYVREGNRKDCDVLDAQQRAHLQNLVLGELVEGKGRFMDAMVDWVWALCERSTWVGTAHLASQKKGAGVPDSEDIIIDLHSGEASALMAWTYYFFKEQFDCISPLIAQRISEELNERTFLPYLTRDDLWWMGFRGSFVNNWNIWCNYNVLMSALLAEKDPQRKRQIVLKTMKSVDRFINYYKNDGGCEEGPSYWGHAPGKLLEYLDALREATGGKIDLFQEPLIRKMGSYIANVHIDSCWFINFADAPARFTGLPTIIFRYGRNTDNKELMAFGKYLGEVSRFSENSLEGSLSMALNNFRIWDEYRRYTGQAPFSRSVWMEGIEVAVGREENGSCRGLFFAAKGGFNNESHNHNDVGTFMLYKNGKPVIVDAGVGTYTSKTFSNKRYEIWNMQSFWHNVPLINGRQQAFGSKYRSSEVHFSDQGKRLIFALDLARAYPAEAACREWKRVYTFSREKALKIEDRYHLSEIKGASSLHFLTASPIKMSKKGVLLLGEGENQVKMRFDPQKMELKLEEKILDDPAMNRVWGNKLILISLTYKEPGLQGKSEIVFE